MATTKDYGSLVEVFRGDLWEAELIKGFLAANGVQAMIKDETVGLITAPYGAIGHGVVVLVNHEEQVFAEKIIKENRPRLKE